MNLINQIFRGRGNYHFASSTLLLIILGLAGWAGNYFSWSLFFGVDFLFGSIAVLLVIRLYGIFWGTLVAVVAGSYTYFLWHHPYALIIFTGEAVFIGLGLRRQKQNLLLLDGIYWLCLGIPLVGLFYGGVMQLPATSVWLILLKQPVNGLFNALVASLLIAHLPWHKWTERQQPDTTLSLRQTLINFLVAFVFLPVLIILMLDSQRFFKQLETKIQVNLDTLSSAIVAEVQFFSQSHHQILEGLAQVALESELKSSPELKTSIALVERTFADFQNLYLIDRNRQVVLAYPPEQEVEKIAPKCPGENQDILSLSSSSNPKGWSKILELTVPIVRNQNALGCVVGEITIEELYQHIKATIQQPEVQITLVDKNHQVIFSTLETRVNTQKFDWRQEGEIRPLTANVFQQLPVEPNLSAMMRWQKSMYVRQQPLAENLDWDLILEAPALTQIKFLQNLYLNHLTLMLVTSCLGVILATLLSQQLVEPLNQLSWATTNLPKKLWQSLESNLPSSGVAEIKSLTHNFQLMSDSLQQNFIQIQQSKQLLEQRVQERTIELNQAKEEAEASARAKSTFISHMSHELRTPLNGILGFTQILQQDPELTSKQLDGLKTIEQCGSHLLTLINNILYLAKSEAGQMELQGRDFDLRSFLEDLSTLISLRAQQKGVVFDYQPQSTLPSLVCWDETRLRQVLLNLLSNAVKFTETGSVTFKVGSVENKRDRKDGEAISQSPTVRVPLLGNPQQGRTTITKILFQVEDTGIGIPPDKLADIFIPFQQVVEGQFAQEGTGLGLTISQQIVQQMGGEIKVESTLGQGSIFWFEIDLPVREFSQQGKPTDFPPHIIGFKGQALLILVVDDQTNNRAVLVNFLSPLGFEVIEATNGEEGLAKARQFQPSLILLDLVMPVLDGFETSRRLRQDPNLSQVTIIAISASILPEERILAEQAGCNAFLPKPIDFERLLEMIQSYLGIEWIYESIRPTTLSLQKVINQDTEEDSASSPIIAPPAEELTLLLELAKQGNIGRILERAAIIKQLGSQYLPFTQRMRQLAESFQEKKLRQFIEEQIQEDS